jgi:D-lactate dehydrogenase
MMKTIAFYDTKPYDRQFMTAAPGADELRWVFHEFRLTADTAGCARGADAVCSFVNDRLDRACLETLVPWESVMWPCVLRDSITWT